MASEKDKSVRNLTETITNIGFSVSFVCLVLLIGGTLATLTYNSISFAPYSKYLASAVFLFFTTVIFALFRIVASDRRRKNIWHTMEEKVTPVLAESQTDYLIRRVGFSVKEFTDSTRWLFRSVRLYKYSTVGLSVVSTIVLGLNFNYLSESDRLLYSTISKNIALVLNTIVTAISTLSIFWNVEKYWIQNKVIKDQLRRLKADIEFEMSKSVGKEIEDEKLVRELFLRHQSILDNFHLYWEGVLTAKGDKEK